MLDQKELRIWFYHNTDTPHVQDGFSNDALILRNSLGKTVKSIVNVSCFKRKTTMIFGSRYGSVFFSSFLLFTCSCCYTYPYFRFQAMRISNQINSSVCHVIM